MGLSPVWGISVHSLEDAAQGILKLLYLDQSPPKSPLNNSTPTKIRRNSEIKRRYANGESVPDLARVFRISEQRVHQILRGTRK
jgi:hypothetical protein